MKLYDITTFQAKTPQKVRNVAIHSPSIVQICSGSKYMFWNNDTIEVSSSSLLLCHNSLSLSFENRPTGRPFVSRFFNFHYAPPATILAASQWTGASHTIPVIPRTPALTSILNALYSLNTSVLSHQTQQHFLNGLYQQLAELGVLPLLFHHADFALNHKIKRFLAASPGEAHTLDSVAERFAMSRATLIRHLKQEGYQFKDILLEVRLNCALSIMQQSPISLNRLAQLCGYQSEQRFSQRFKHRFGLTPRDYLRTTING